MFKSITLQAGPSSESPPLSIQLSPVTIFVGPNNSGKSQFLRELARFCESHKKQHFRILSDADPLPFNSDEVAEFIEMCNDRYVQFDDGKIRFSSNTSDAATHDQLNRMLTEPTMDGAHFRNLVLRPQVQLLTGDDRLQMMRPQNHVDLHQFSDDPHNIIFSDNALRSQISAIFFETFGQHLVADITRPGQIRYRLSKTEPASESVEKSMTAEAIAFQKQGRTFDELSDGVNAFAGIVFKLFSRRSKLTLIDEPESFLHPTLSNILGRETARSIASSNRRVVVATHSAHFLMGCVEADVDVSVVRLTYDRDCPTARKIDSEELLEMMRDPLLRSTGILDGLFCDAVIVTESDADRAFYQEINRRLNQSAESDGVPGCLFVNAQGIDSIHHIVRMLRRLGVPAAGILDVDVLNNGGRKWQQLLESASIPPANRKGLGQTRSDIHSAAKRDDKDLKTKGGIYCLQDHDREAAENLVSHLADYGLFIIPGGELESWMSHLDTGGLHGPPWLTKVFQLMGSDPDDEAYAKPKDADVWDFMRLIRRWMIDPNRKGIPE